MNYGEKKYLASRKEVDDHKNDKTNPHVYSVTGTLTKNTTNIVLNHNSLSTNCTIDVYTSVYGVNPQKITLAKGSIALTFEAQSEDISVKVVFY